MLVTDYGVTVGGLLRAIEACGCAQGPDRHILRSWDILYFCQLHNVIAVASWLTFCDTLSGFMKNLQYMREFLESSASLPCSVRMVLFLSVCKQDMI